MEIETKAIHSGYSPDPTTNAVAVPIYQTTAYAFDDTQHGADLFNLAVLGNIYTRIMNPTTDVLEQRIADMEGGVAALGLASGQAATAYSIQTITEAGDNIISTSTLYGGTYNLFAHTFPQMGIETRFVDPENLDSMAALIDDRTKCVFCESIGNPAGNIIDLEKIAEIAHAHGVPVIVDNTVASPVLCNPFQWGADIIVHSLTKYIGGHGTIIGGIIVDSNNFDWVANKDRFKRLNEPDVSYHGVVFTETGLPPYILRARVVPFCRCAWSEFATTRWPWPNTWKAIRKSNGCATRVSTAALTRRSPTSTRRAKARVSSLSASRAVSKPVPNLSTRCSSSPGW